MEAMLGPNTKQWWIYDDDTNEFIDPPVYILDELKRMPAETADDIDRQGDRLIEFTNNGTAKWLNDGHRYLAENMDI